MADSDRGRARKGAIAIDHGTKRTGFAATDAARLLVSPLHAVTGGDAEALAALAALLDERDVSHVVVGYPFNMDGTKGGRAAEVERFIDALAARFPGLVVVRQDERLSTKEAEERLKDAGHFGDARKARKDAWSAMVLLEDWIAAGEPGA
jgi:putative holliday junction resolvase